MYEASAEQKLRRLSLLAEQVSSYSMRNISKTVLRGLYRKEPEKMRVSFALAAKFYDWCREDGRYSGPNPFQEFLEEVPRKKTKTDALQRKAIELKSLPKKVETELNRLVEAASWTDLCVTGLLLIKEAGLTARDASELRWKDMLLNELKDDWNLTKGERCKSQYGGKASVGRHTTIPARFRPLEHGS